MVLDSQVLEESSEQDATVSETDYQDRMHIEYDIYDEVVDAFFRETDVQEEELFSEDTVIGPEELPSIKRREFLAGAAYLGGTYTADSKLNSHYLEKRGADNFEAPLPTIHEKAVEEMLKENEITVRLYDMRFGGQKLEYDEQEIVSHVENAINELEGTNFRVDYQALNASEQEPLDEEESYREIINNGSLDRSRESRVLASQTNSMINSLTDSQPADKDIVVAIADFAEEGAEGLSTFDRSGRSLALIKRAGQEDTEERIIHELGHELGLPHTKYPDLKRWGFLPDAMSYSNGSISAPIRGYRSLTDNAFGQQSHYNWGKVREKYGQ